MTTKETMQIGRPRDVFAEVAELAVGAALRRKPAHRLRWTWKAMPIGIRRMTATAADGTCAYAEILAAVGGWEVSVRRCDTYALVAAASGIRSLKLARSIARGMVKGVFGWALRRRRNAARRAKAEKEA